MSNLHKKRKRNVWPRSHSKFLRHEFFREVLEMDWEDCSPVGAATLVFGSDDELDEDAGLDKKRRITKLANSFLDGRSVLIASASLRGPFGVHDESDDDGVFLASEGAQSSVHEDGLEAHSASTGTGDSIIEERSTRSETTPDPAKIDSINAQSPTSSERPPISLKTPPRAEASFISPRSGQDDNVRSPKSDSSPSSALADLQAAADQHSPAEECGLGSMDDSDDTERGLVKAKRLSLAGIEVSEQNMEGITEAKRLSQIAISSQLSNDPPENQIHDRTNLSRDSCNSNSSNSPFKFRYKRERSAQNIHEHGKDMAESGNAASGGRLSTERTAETSRPKTPDLLSLHTGKKLGRLSPGDLKRRAIKGDLRRMMRGSGATFEYEGDSPPTPQQQSDQLGGDRFHTAPDSHSEIPFSTQAALQQAHRDLMTPGFAEIHLSPKTATVRQKSADLSQSPAPRVTPFAELKFAHSRQGSLEQHISTQAMLASFTPFKIPEEMSRSLHAQIEVEPTKTIQCEAADGVEIAPKSARDSGTSCCLHRTPSTTNPAERPFGQIHPESHALAVTTDAGWSFDPLDRDQKVPQESTCVNASSTKSLHGLKGLGFKVTKSLPQPGSNLVPDGDLSKTATSYGGAGCAIDVEDVDAEVVDPYVPHSQRSRKRRRKRKSLKRSQTIHNESSQDLPTMQHRSDINRSHTPSGLSSFSHSRIGDQSPSSVIRGGAAGPDCEPGTSQHSPKAVVMQSESRQDSRRSPHPQVSSAFDDGPIGVDEPIQQSNVSRVPDSMNVPDETDSQPPRSTTSFTIPSLPASRARFSFDSTQSPDKRMTSTFPDSGSAPNRNLKGSLKSSTKKTATYTPKSVLQNAQVDDGIASFDLDASLDEIREEVLGGWNVEEEAAAL